MGCGASQPAEEPEQPKPKVSSAEMEAIKAKMAEAEAKAASTTANAKGFVSSRTMLAAGKTKPKFSVHRSGGDTEEAQQINKAIRMKQQKQLWEKANTEKEKKRKEARERRIASGQGILARMSLRRASFGSRRASETESAAGDEGAAARTSRARLSRSFFRRGSAAENRGSRLSLISGFRRHKEPPPVEAQAPAPADAMSALAKDGGSFKQPNVPTAVHQLPAPNALPSYRHAESPGAASRASEEEEEEEGTMLAGVKKASAASSSSFNASKSELPAAFQGAHGI